MKQKEVLRNGLPTFCSIKKYKPFRLPIIRDANIAVCRIPSPTTGNFHNARALTNVASAKADLETRRPKRQAR